MLGFGMELENSSQLLLPLIVKDSEEMEKASMEGKRKEDGGWQIKRESERQRERENRYTKIEKKWIGWGKMRWWGNEREEERIPEKNTFGNDTHNLADALWNTCRDAETHIAQIKENTPSFISNVLHINKKSSYSQQVLQLFQHKLRHRVFTYFKIMHPYCLHRS